MVSDEYSIDASCSNNGVEGEVDGIQSGRQKAIIDSYSWIVFKEA
jgi:hypothetical protein